MMHIHHAKTLYYGPTALLNLRNNLHVNHKSNQTSVPGAIYQTDALSKSEAPDKGMIM